MSVALRMGRQCAASSCRRQLVSSSTLCLKFASDPSCCGALKVHQPQNVWLSTRSFSSHSWPTQVEESPLDDLIGPDAVCPIYGEEGNAPLRPRRYLECGIAEDLITYRTTTFGKLLEAPFVHTQEHQITIQIPIDDLPLDDIGKKICQQVVGYGRYDVKRRIFKMSANHFPSRIENKRYLTHKFNRLMLACQKAAKTVSLEKLEEIGVKTDA